MTMRPYSAPECQLRLFDSINPAGQGVWLSSAEGAVDLELFGEEAFDHSGVTAAVGFGDLGAELALTAFEAAAFERVERAFDLGELAFGVDGSGFVECGGELGA